MAIYKGHNEDSSGNILLSIGNGMTATVETGSTASQAYTKGSYIFFNNRFCKATSAIASGATLAIGTNLSETSVGAELTSHLRSSDGKEFYFDVKDGSYGYYPSASKTASEFVPFGGSVPSTLTVVIGFPSVAWGHQNISVAPFRRLGYTKFKITGNTSGGGLYYYSDAAPSSHSQEGSLTLNTVYNTADYEYIGGFCSASYITVEFSGVSSGGAPGISLVSSTWYQKNTTDTTLTFTVSTGKRYIISLANGGGVSSYYPITNCTILSQATDGWTLSYYIEPTANTMVMSGMPNNRILNPILIEIQ